MITDCDTNTIYFSSLLEKRYKTFSDELFSILASENIATRFIENTSDIWCRDFMPVQVSKDKFVLFKYDPAYLKKHPHLKTDQSKLALPRGTMESRIVLDGGNVVRCKNKVIVTDTVFKENPWLGKHELIDKLTEELEVDEVIVIPHQPYDFTGHADGMIRFIDDKHVLLNDYVLVPDYFLKKLNSVLNRHKLEVVPMPYFISDILNADGDETALGCYINYMHCGNCIVVPSFLSPYDDEAALLLSNVFTDCTIRTIDSRELAMQSGVLNCICWNAFEP